MIPNYADDVWERETSDVSYGFCVVYGKIHKYRKQ